MDMAYNFIVLRDCFGEFGQQRSNITSPIRYDPDIDRSIRVSVRQSFNFSGYVSGGHTDQQIEARGCPSSLSRISVKSSTKKTCTCSAVRNGFEMSPEEEEGGCISSHTHGPSGFPASIYAAKGLAPGWDTPWLSA